jgi:vitamin B12 transporter
MTLSLRAVLLCSAIFPLCAFAQDPLELLITPTRTATPAKAVGSAISVITASEIERKQSKTIAEALQGVPGISISPNGGRGQTTSVFIRGAKSEHTLMLIDGVEQNDPSSTSNAYDFSRLSTDNVERIEVLRGSQSTLYGTDAIGGVINIITKKGDGPAQFTGTAEYGNHNSSFLSGGVSGSTEKLRYSATVSNDQTNGFSAFNKTRGGVETDGNRSTTFSGRLDGSITDAISAYTTLRYNNSRAEFDGFGTDEGNINEAEEISTRIAATANLWDEKWTQELGASYSNIDRDIASSFGPSSYEGERSKIDWVHTIKPITRHIITGGVETEQDRFISDFDGKQSNRNHAAFLQDQWNVMDNLYITFGGRFDHNEAFGNKSTYRIAPAYTVDATGTLLKASYGTGFKAPSLFQLYSFFGNRNLNPETSKGFDAGFEQPLLDGRLRFGSSVFQLDIEDLIDYSFATNAYVNVGSAKTHGLESFIHYAPMASLSFALTHTYTLAEDETDDSELLRRPRHSFALDSNWNVTDAVRLGASLNYVGVRTDIDETFSETRMGGYPLVNLNADWNAMKNLSLYGRINNLLDRQYENVYGYGTEGLSGYAGVKVKY